MGDPPLFEDLILDTQGLQSPASQTGLSSHLELTWPILLPFAQAKTWPITALELPEVNKPRERISGVGICIALQYIQIPAIEVTYVRCGYDLDSFQIIEFKNNLFRDLTVLFVWNVL
jgi:hypothetical protein